MQISLFYNTIGNDDFGLINYFFQTGLLVFLHNKAKFLTMPFVFFAFYAALMAVWPNYSYILTTLFETTA